jgi:hypothetical protein
MFCFGCPLQFFKRGKVPVFCYNFKKVFSTFVGENERGGDKIKMINVANCSKLCQASQVAQKTASIYYPRQTFPQKIIIDKLATVCFGGLQYT